MNEIHIQGSTHHTRSGKPYHIERNRHGEWRVVVDYGKRPAGRWASTRREAMRSLAALCRSAGPVPG